MKPPTYDTENIFISHAHTEVLLHFELLFLYEQCLEHCQWSHCHDMSVDWLMKNWMAGEMCVACPEQRRQHPYSYCHIVFFKQDL